MITTKEEVVNNYKSRLKYYSAKLESTKKTIRKLSVFRIALFVITIIGIYLASGVNWILLTVIAIVGFSSFIVLVIKHTKLFKQKQWYDTLLKINQTELSVMAGNTSEKDEGLGWLDPEHPFVADLDVFGKSSLFQLIDRSATVKGKKQLADILLSPFTDKKTIELRQAAIKELQLKQDFRQHFQATGNLNDDKTDGMRRLVEWVKKDQLNYNTVFNKLMLVLNPLIGISVVVLISVNLLNFSYFLFFLAIPFLILTPRLKQINLEYAKLSRQSKQLRNYASLLNLVEKEIFESETIIKIKDSLSLGDHAASKAIAKLSSISSAFDYRLNLLVGIFLNIFFLWDILQLIRLEKWKSENSKYINEWFVNLAHIDELCSFSGFAFNNPDSVFPEISEKPFELKAKNARHPFISADKSIGNDVSFTGWQQFHIITGANMAGKSTYLRTIGINMLLGMTGSPVLADQFIFRPVSLFTGIKTSDSLQEGESYFFAELKRLETIIRNLASGEKIFIILDEILRGTNSADKQKGSKALIKQLVKVGASGLIATHDLALGELADVFPNNVVNKRFEVEIKQNELIFDYKLKDGISQNLNATFLMKKMGITME